MEHWSISSNSIYSIPNLFRFWSINQFYSIWTNSYYLHSLSKDSEENIVKIKSKRNYSNISGEILRKLSIWTNFFAKRKDFDEDFCFLKQFTIETIDEMTIDEGRLLIRANKFDRFDIICNFVGLSIISETFGLNLLWSIIFYRFF